MQADPRDDLARCTDLTRDDLGTVFTLIFSSIYAETREKIKAKTKGRQITDNDPPSPCGLRRDGGSPVIVFRGRMG